MSPSAWKNRDFLFLLGGQTVSKLGTAVTTFTIPWLLLQLTGSAAQTGIAFAVGFVPYLLVSLPAGVWSDRFNRKHLMILADGGRLILLLSIPVVHVLSQQTPVWLLFCVQAGISLLSAIFDSSYGSCLPNIVPRSQLQEANAALHTGSSMSQIGGPVLAGILVSFLGTADTLTADVVSYAISIVTLVMIRSSFSQSQTTTSRTNGMRSDIRQGVQYIWRTKPMRTLALFSMLVNLVGPGIDVALIFRIQHELHAASALAGVIMTGLSCGMVAGSMMIGRLAKRFGMGVLLLSSAIGQIFPPFILAVTNSPIVIVAAQFVTGLLLVAWNVQIKTLRQAIIPDELLGRCVSVFRLIAWIFIPVGDAAAGIVSQLFGAPCYFIIAGCVLLMVCFIAAATKIHRVSETMIPIDAPVAETGTS